MLRSHRLLSNAGVRRTSRRLSRVAASGANDDRAARLAALVEEEQRLALQEKALAVAELEAAAKERELSLWKSANAVTSTASTTCTTTSSSSTVRSHSDTQVEVAALRALMTAGRHDVTGAAAVSVDVPSTRVAFDWQDVEWSKLSWHRRVSTAAGIILGRTREELRDEWSFARADGFGARSLGTLLLAFFVVMSCAHALLASSTGDGGLRSALAARPFALLTSTLLIVARVLLSAALLLAEKACDVIYYTPAAVAAPLLALLLLYRRECTKRGVLPFWARRPQLVSGTQRVSFVFRVPLPAPFVVFRGAEVPKAASSLLNMQAMDKSDAGAAIDADAVTDKPADGVSPMETLRSRVGDMTHLLRGGESNKH